MEKLVKTRGKSGEHSPFIPGISTFKTIKKGMAAVLSN
ncbi:hypothetical protein B4144_3865 [Bacillus atrophaeus]|nr:hypothetical protein B4144_3865 [Bacillus atrophaeus]